MNENITSITITLSTTNDAFQPSPNEETARILRTLAAHIEDGYTPNWLYDANGNNVGKVSTSTL